MNTTYNKEDFKDIVDISESSNARIEYMQKHADVICKGISNMTDAYIKARKEGRAKEFLRSIGQDI